MTRFHPAKVPGDDVPADPAMRLIEVGLAILALAAAAVLALFR